MAECPLNLELPGMRKYADPLQESALGDGLEVLTIRYAIAGKSLAAAQRHLGGHAADCSCYLHDEKLIQERVGAVAS